MSVLKLEHVKKDFTLRNGLKTTTINAVKDASFELASDKTIALVGESGSGKSVEAYSIIGLLQNPGKVVGGSITFEGQDMLSKTKNEMINFRGKEVAMIFQNPMTCLNPVYTIGNQLVEALKAHDTEISKEDAAKHAMKMLEEVGINNVEKRMKQYPHELSGGMRQRVMIAMGLICHPKLLIADEPTTALDVVVQKGILMMLMRLQKQFKNTMIIVSHDMGVHYQITDRMAIMYSGSVAELGKTEDIFNDPIHPYTKMLVDALPRVGEDVQRVGIAGRPPALKNPPPGCRFAPRCPHATDRCRSEVPKFREIRPGRFAACHLLEEEVKTNG